MLTLRKNLKTSTSLNAQIREAEQQLLSRRQMIAGRTATLIKDIHRKITAPSSLLLASEMGFIMAEFSKCPTPQAPDTGNSVQAREMTFFTSSLNLMLSAYTLYKALPVTWLMKCFSLPDKRQDPPKRENE
ncbi:hypothetical protein IVG45_05420 [Methylomonas sp. LL1]|uniref:hypothetical protein n=1 Tax=Methylomonas sp. LL1 TaxID=2785785 RepID=UPI0018C3BAFD|nr:hypothetical protein [Methylomonas sp. LL1]QPK64406.1 hypothetical protein IVG45_05420 [Methylomonas sp. LL1]CAG1022241.1 hypothetical protein MTYM_01577 [Methylococcales bacterium]